MSKLPDWKLVLLHFWLILGGQLGQLGTNFAFLIVLQTFFDSVSHKLCLSNCRIFNVG